MTNRCFLHIIGDILPETRHAKEECGTERLQRVLFVVAACLFACLLITGHGRLIGHEVPEVPRSTPVVHSALCVAPEPSTNAPIVTLERRDTEERIVIPVHGSAVPNDANGNVLVGDLDYTRLVYKAFPPQSGFS